MGFHARRGDLRAEHVAVAVEHEAGQPVAFAVAQAVERHVEQRFTQQQGAFEAFFDEGCVERLVGLAADDARGDERSRVDVGRPDGAPVGGADLCGLARRERRQRGALHVHFVAENPQVPRPQAAVFIFFEEKLLHGCPLGGEG